MNGYITNAEWHAAEIKFYGQLATLLGTIVGSIVLVVSIACLYYSLIEKKEKGINQPN